MSAIPADGAPALSDADSSAFGFGAGHQWFSILRAAMARDALGTIGPYELIEEVARGGQGIVHRARQPDVPREIAIKRLIAGSFASDGARRRFAREVEAVATLQHPGIVTVYGMEVVDGQPMLAMEWIDGVPINRWAGGELGGGPPGRDAILRTFLQVCDAVQHAHQRGILHRDLKPENVLVDRDLRPRVLDFGLAIAIDRRTSQGSTAAGFRGTLAYASPEQLDAPGGSSVPDVRGDVYSLGVILYELLAGRLPSDPTEGVQAHLLVLELRRYPRLSALRRDLRRDFDSIVARALAREPADRYASVSQFADDVRRYLDGRPVRAHAQGRWYRAARLVRRNKAVSALSASIVLGSLTFGLIAWRQARAVTVERDAAQRARADEARARDAAQREANDARAILDFFLDDVLLHAAGPGHLDATIGDLLDVALEQVDARFASRPETEARVRRRLGELFRTHGDYPRAEQQLRAAVSLLNDADIDDPERRTHQLGHGETALGVALIHLGRLTEAIEHLRRAIEHFAARHPPDAPQIVRTRRLLADALIQRFQLDQAREQLHLALREAHALDPADPDLESWIRHSLARCAVLLGEIADGRAQHEALLAFNREHFGDSSEHLAASLESLSVLDAAAGEMTRARDHAVESIRVLGDVYHPDHPRVASVRQHLARVLLQLGELDQADAEVTRALVAIRGTHGDESIPARQVEGVAAWILVRRGRAAEGIALMQAVVDAFAAALGADSPLTTNAQAELNAMRELR